MRDVRAAGVDVMTFGQYMRPTKRHMPVSEYVTPEGFNSWRRLGEDMVRCSWQVEEADGDN
jgi:lipoic acid synthetase